jgi:hypothetical protein
VAKPLGQYPKRLSKGVKPMSKTKIWGPKREDLIRSVLREAGISDQEVLEFQYAFYLFMVGEEE